MTFIEAFEKIKKSKKKDIVSYADCAIQVELIDSDAAGIMYIQIKDGVVLIEPYDYVDNDVSIKVLSKDMVRILTGRLNVSTALKKGLVKTSRDSDVVDVLSLIAGK